MIMAKKSRSFSWDMSSTSRFVKNEVEEDQDPKPENLSEFQYSISQSCPQSSGPVGKQEESSSKKRSAASVDEKCQKQSEGTMIVETSEAFSDDGLETIQSKVIGNDEQQDESLNLSQDEGNRKFECKTIDPHHQTALVKESVMDVQVEAITHHVCSRSKVEDKTSISRGLDISVQETDSKAKVKTTTEQGLDSSDSETESMCLQFTKEDVKNINSSQNLQHEKGEISRDFKETVQTSSKLEYDPSPRPPPPPPLELAHNDKVSTDLLKSVLSPETLNHKEKLKRTCSICGKLHRSNAADWKNHCQTHTNFESKEKPYQCNNCPKVFSRKEHLTRHKITHTTETPYHCKLCPVKFTSDGSLLYHVKRYHTMIKSHKCQFCDLKVWTASQKKEHEKTHMTEKPFNCDICQKNFSRKMGLITHLKTHLGLKEFECKYCGKLFTQNGNLKIHERIHTSNHPYKCSHCSKAFAQKGHMHLHVRTNHTHEKPFQCPQCTWRCTDKQSLNVHIRMHEGVRYACSLCDQSFSRKLTLKDHQKRYHIVTELNHKCRFCAKSFSQTRSWRRHEREKHSEEND